MKHKPVQCVSLEEVERLAELRALSRERDPAMTLRTGDWQTPDYWSAEDTVRYEAERKQVRFMLYG